MSNFKYNYVPVEQLESKQILLEPGHAHFIIKAYYDKNKDGSPSMTKGKRGEPGVRKVNLLLSVTDSNGQEGMIYDVITVNTAWKIHQLSEALGILDIYNIDGILDLDKLVNKKGECLIKTSESIGYPAKTVIEKYLSHVAMSFMENPREVIGKSESVSGYNTNQDNDDIPF
jgi:hypothetical protein